MGGQRIGHCEKPRAGRGLERQDTGQRRQPGEDGGEPAIREAWRVGERMGSPGGKRALDDRKPFRDRRVGVRKRRWIASGAQQRKEPPHGRVEGEIAPARQHPVPRGEPWIGGPQRSSETKVVEIVDDGVALGEQPPPVDQGRDRAGGLIAR